MTFFSNGGRRIATCNEIRVEGNTAGIMIISVMQHMMKEQQNNTKKNPYHVVTIIIIKMILNFSGYLTPGLEGSLTLQHPPLLCLLP